MTDRHQPTPATSTPPVGSSTGSSEPKGRVSPSTVAGNTAGLALPTTAATLAPGPIFSASDFQRALEALDLVLQNFAWEKGDNYLIVGSLFNTLSAKGITRALAKALLDWLIEQKIFQPWSRTYSAGYSHENGMRVLRLEPETIYGLVTTRERWYGFLAERKQRGSVLEPCHGVGNSDPYRALLTFALRVHAEEFECLTSLAGKRRPLPEEWGPHFRTREQELQTLVEAALRGAERTGFAVIDVERRVQALAQSILAILLWLRDTPPHTPAERERLESAGVWQQVASAYLGTHFRAMMAAWEAVQTLAVRSEVLPGPSSDGNPNVSIPVAAPPLSPSERINTESEYVEFSVKQRQLLMLLCSHGVVTMAQIKESLYGHKATENSTVERLVSRTNQSLIKRGYAQEIKRKSNTYSLEPL